MELDEAPAPTSRLDHLAELATSPSHAIVNPPSSSSSTSSVNSNSRHSQYSHSQDDSRSYHSSHRSSPPPSSSYVKDARASSPVAHHSRSQIVREQLEAESAPGWGRSPITPTTTRKFNRMAIQEVLDVNNRGASHHNEDSQNSPPYKRKGSPEDSFSDPPTTSRTMSSTRGSYSTSSDHPSNPHYTPRQPRSPRYRNESPMPQSNSEDEDSDVRSYKKRRMHNSLSSNAKLLSSSPPSASGPPEVFDQVRKTLNLKQQQKAIIEARQSGASTNSSGPLTPSLTSQNSKPKESSTPSSNSSQPVTEKTSSGISIFHGSASFAALSRRPLTSPKNPKNAKSLTIFAPSYSDSSLSIHSAPLQPSHAHQAMSMNPRTSQPIRNHTPHPFSQQPTGTIPQPLRSPKSGHVKKSSRVTLRAGPQTAGLDNRESSGTLPAPILSSHTGPLPSPAMYPIPPTPFHPPAHGPAHVSKPAFMETISNLFDSVDSSRSLRTTLEEQIRKSAQLLQTLQSSGTMIESLVRGQFKELEKGVIEKFENELDYLSQRVRQLEEHQGLTPPPKRVRVSAPTPSKTSAESTTGSLPSPTSGSNSNNHGKSSGSGLELKEGTLPTPPFNKNQDSAMDVEDEEPSTVTSSASTSASSSPPRDQPAEYHSTPLQKLGER
ncbi:hypothetical protein BGZ76_004656, partial [Entomortierella beljakovae]